MPTLRAERGWRTPPSFAWADATMQALDRWRLLAFRVVLRNRAFSSLMVLRDRRLAILSGMHMVIAAALALLFPVLLFVLAPVALGVAHVASDVRYLVLRRTLAPWWRSAVLVACVSLFALQGLALLRVVGTVERVELALVSVWASLGVLAAGFERRAWRRAGVGFFLVLLVATLALVFPSGFRQAFAHAHNLELVLLLYFWVAGTPLGARRTACGSP